MPLSVSPAGNCPGQRDKARHAIRAFPVRVLLAAEGHGAGVGPGVVVRAVVGGVLDDGVVGQAEFIDQLEQFADMAVVFDHAIGVFVIALVAVLPCTWVRKCMRVPFHQQKNGLPAACLAFDEILGGGEGFLVDGLHALLGQRAEVFDGLTTFAIGFALEHAAGPELLR